MTPLLVQMSGAPGSGKSTLARAIAPEQLVAGQQVATDHGAGYRYVECVTENLDVIAARLPTRTAYPTQYRDMDQVPATAGSTSAAGTAGWRQWIDGMKRPADRSLYRRVDTSRPASECAAGILRFDPGSVLL